VTAACIAKAKKSKNATTRKRAGFAASARTVARRKKGKKYKKGKK